VLHIIIDNNPEVPDLTQAVLEGETSPLPVLVQGCRSLEKAGADFIIMPCVTAHYYEKPLKQEAELPLLSILDVVAEHIVQCHPRMKRIGLMGTDGTLQSGIFQKRLNAHGLETRICPPEMQERVMDAIYAIKGIRSDQQRKKITDELAAVAAYLIKQGAQGIIAGCTEIPLALGQHDVSAPYFDSLLLLARAAIRKAGREPI
jgi:aspartate racemase